MPLAEPESPPDVAPSPLASLTASTAPHVVAATRLADEGRQRLAAGDLDTALEQLERAIAIDPANPYAYYYLAEIHFARGSYQQAIAFGDRAAILSARADSGLLSRAFGLQGKVFEAAGRFADARAAYQRAIETDHSNRAAQMGLARVSGGPPPAP